MKPGTARASVSSAISDGKGRGRRPRFGSLTSQIGAHALAAGGLLGAPLAALAMLAGARKLADPQRAELYRRWLAPRRWQRLNVLIVGLSERHGGDGVAVLDLWRAWLPRAEIAAIDAADETRHSRGRAHVYQCGPADKGGLERIARIYGGFDVVMDTGAESDSHTLRTFDLLLAHLRPGGVYIAESPRPTGADVTERGPLGHAVSPRGRGYHAWLHDLADEVAAGEGAGTAAPTMDRRRHLASIQMAPGLVIVQRQGPPDQTLSTQRASTR